MYMNDIKIAKTKIYYKLINNLLKFSFIHTHLLFSKNVKILYLSIIYHLVINQSEKGIINIDYCKLYLILPLQKLIQISVK